MAKRKRRFVGKAKAKIGWRIWDNKIQRWWGEPYKIYPMALLEELNGQKRSAQIIALQGWARKGTD